MTSRSTEIQTLIADIDSLLANKGKRALRVLANNQGQEPRQVLERIRNFLESIDQELQQSDAQSSAALLSPLVARYIGQDTDDNSQNQTNQNQPNQNLTPQAPLNELRALMEPLHIELQGLLKERKNLVEEIRQLEQQRLHNYSLANQMANQEQMIAEFLQVLANRVSKEGLQVDPVKTLTQTSTTITTTETDASSKLIERISSSYGELDKKIVDLDSNINSFEDLQRHLNSYQESLSASVARMQHDGTQGEQLLKNWIENLMQQLQSINVFLSELVNKSQVVQSNLEQKIVQYPIQAATGRNTVSLPDVDSSLVDDVNATPDLDALLLELNPDADSYDTSVSQARSIGLQQTNKFNSQPKVKEVAATTEQLESDEVDLLYASLFGADDVAVSTPVTPPGRNPITVTQDLPTPEVVTVSTQSEVILNTINTLDTVDTVNEIVTEADTKSETVISTISIEPTSAPITELVNTTTLNQQEEPIPPIVVLNQTHTETEIINITTQTVPSESLDELLDTSVETNTETETLDIANHNDTIDLTNTTAFVPDPWLDNGDAELLDLHDLQTQDQKTSVADQTSYAWEAFVNIDNAYIAVEPTDADTITALTDLVFEDVPKLSSAATQEENQLQQHNFIAASPNEVLLPQATVIDAAMPNISLNDDQIQRLDEDLENFDSDEQTGISSRHSRPQKTEPKVEESPVPPEEPAISATAPSISSAETQQPTLNSIDDSINIADTADSAWYLGIDLGTTGISAALLNRSTAEVYPVYWSTETDINANGAKRSFRLPAEVYLPASAGVPIGSEQNTDSPITPSQNLFSAELKPYLQVALAYRSEKTQHESSEDSKQEPSYKWEPVLQLNEVATVPLVWMVRSLSKLLLTLKSDRNSTTLGLTATAIGINQESFGRIIDNIAGVVCSCPSNWSEQYRFNIREALLLSKLIYHPQQVFFVEEAIASLLSELDGANGEEVKLNTRTGARPAKSSDHPLDGNTLIMNIGASATEMALVELPENLLTLSHNDFMLHSFAYGGKGIEIDILCQLLLPPKWRQPVSEKQSGESISSNPLHWQPSIQGLENTQLSSLKWEELTLPRPGEPDIAERIRLLQRLESSRLGQALLDAATAMKLILQHQESFSFELADQRWLLQRRDLESQVFVPFVRRLNRELNRLLVARGIPTEAINQSILTGGVATLGAVSRWLRQKLPNARIIQDLYLGDSGAPTCSRVAYGLSLLALHPQVLEVSRQQYTDYFLFTELLRVLPEHALSFGEVIGLFEERGINTRNCQQRLLAFLEGELPAGLIPGSTESIWLTQASMENFDYKTLLSTPLFEKQGSLTYRPNIEQIQYLRNFLDIVKASTQQSLEEPYTVNFAVGVAL